ncbi:MAG: CPBP family intramembrane metalloprotease [Dehalococcoidia bacterium]|nr:CPBP family intramembrane metalloprotease [Dehalococcoidia bacterium]
MTPQRTYPWGPKEVLTGLGGFLIVFIISNAFIATVAVMRDKGFEPKDAGNIFEKLDLIASYADQRLAAAADGKALPAPPRILADQGALQLGMFATLVTQVLLFAVVGIASKQSFHGLTESLGLRRFNAGRIWVVGGAVIAAYFALFLYSQAMEATGIDWLTPNSTVPTEISRNDLTLSIAAAVTLIGAPISEELFFRGLLFSGLLKWGFWPAAMLSGFMFSVVHFDPGSFIPFVGIATLMAYLYWRKGCLWDSILFHFAFNGVSMAILVATR